jgi:hypothetical protein
MHNKAVSFNNFVILLEGGAAIKTSRRIREDEFEGTLASIKDVLFPIIGVDPNPNSSEYIVIGSIGKKKNPDDTSGDLDLGIDSNLFNVPMKEVSGYIYSLLSGSDEMIAKLGFEPEINYLKGLNIVSIGWPINGDQTNGIVQLDLIPVADIEWAKFIYYSPDYKTSESKYKSAHRNWLLAAILAIRRMVLDVNDAGEVMDYDSPVLILSDGLYWHTKSYRGKLKPRLKNAAKISGSERFVTRDPQEFIDFALGSGYSINDVKTFEKLYQIISSPNFELYDKVDEIEEKFLEYITRANLERPSEIKRA